MIGTGTISVVAGSSPHVQNLEVSCNKIDLDAPRVYLCESHARKGG